MNRERCRQRIKGHEGLRLVRYFDSQDIPTIGWGFNLIKDGARERIKEFGLDYDAVLRGEQQITEAQADSLFDLDFQDAVQDGPLLVSNFARHPDEMQEVIVDMRYQLGAVGFKKFRKAIAALENLDYGQAAIELADSLWAQQTPDRAEENIAIVQAVNQQKGKN